MNIFQTIFTGVVATVLSAVLLSIINWLGKKLQSNDNQSETTRQFFEALRIYSDKFGELLEKDQLDTTIQLEILGTSSNEVYSINDLLPKAIERNMLILGKEGSGKSTCLKGLTLGLIDNELKKGENYESTKLPVYLPLHKWVNEKKRIKKEPFKVWLSKYLEHELRDTRLDSKLINSWMYKGKFILVMDELDEISDEDSQACLDAIQQLRKETGSRIIMSCQFDRYEALVKSGHPLNISEKKVAIQELKPPQIKEYLDQKGATALIHFLFQTEEGQEVREIAITPLILNLLTKVPIEDIKNIEKEELLKALWKIYVNRAIGAGDFYNVENKKNDLKLYNGQDARFWLEKLAKHMGNNRTFSFLPENLPEEKETKILYLGSTWFVLLLLGTAAYLLVQYEHVSPWQLLPLLAIIAGFYGYLIIAFLTELYMTVLYILTAVWLSFSVAASIGLTKWQKRKEALTTVAFLFVPVILLNTVLFIWGWVSSLPIWVIIFVVWLIGGLFWYKFYWLSSFGVFQGFIPRYLVANTWLALRNLMVFNQIEEFPLTEKLFLKPSLELSLFSVLLPGIPISIMCAVIIWAGFFFWQTNFVPAVIILGIGVWLDRGLGASIRSYILRFCFWKAEILPWTAGFLEDAVDDKLLVRQGNSYRFWNGNHLQKYFSK